MHLRQKRHPMSPCLKKLTRLHHRMDHHPLSENPNAEDLHIASVNNRPNTEVSTQTMREIINNNTNTVVAGDFYAQNTMWGSRTTDVYGTALEYILEELNLLVHQTEGPTYAPSHSHSYFTFIFYFSLLLNLKYCYFYFFFH
jgi:hypothetical protein